MVSDDRRLTGLDAVPWGQLEHAEGNAYDTPQHLRGLLADDPAERVAAQGWVARMLVFDGRLYTASAAAVPFIVAMAIDRATPDRPWLLRLLAALAVGDTNAAVETGFDVTAYEMRGYFKTEGAKPYRDSYRAVEVLLKPLLPLLTARDPELRAAAAFATAFFARRADLVRDALTNALACETEPSVAGVMLIAFGFQNGYLNDYDTSLLEGFLKRPSPLRLAAAIAICRGVAPEPEALEVLIEALGEPTVAAPVPEYLWNDGYLAQMGITALMRQIPPEEQEDNAGPHLTKAQKLLLTLIERVPAATASSDVTAETTAPVGPEAVTTDGAEVVVSPPNRADVDSDVLELAIDALTTLSQTVLPDEPPEKPWTRSNMRPMLRRFVELAASRPELMPDDMSAAMAHAGLPPDLAQLRALVRV